MLENARFYKDEEKNIPEFAQKLAVDTKATVYVNDAFGTAHRYLKVPFLFFLFKFNF